MVFSTTPRRTVRRGQREATDASSGFTTSSRPAANQMPDFLVHTSGGTHYRFLYLASHRFELHRPTGFAALLASVRNDQTNPPNT